MINKNEILALSKALSLNPNTVEKDYVLGWVLWGIGQDKDIFQSWAFKGGTSLKKCFFETFRFSEDLDFTVTKPEHLSSEFLLSRFKNIAEMIYEKSGIEFHKKEFKFEIMPKKSNKFSSQGKIQYSGPLQRKGSFASIKLDLTTDEIIILDRVKKAVYHPYSDKPEGGIFANCYAFEEVIAEKIRALGQRARPRDLYDIIHFFRNKEMIENPQLVFNILRKKCGYKQIAVPTFDFIKQHEKIEEMGSQWHNMLAHQLPFLPPLESFWGELAPFFSWLEGNVQEKHFVEISDKDEQIFQPGRIESVFSANAIIHKIQFAAANRICVEIFYHDHKRIVEPLSFRISKDQNKLFYGYERNAAQVKCYHLAKIKTIDILNLPYKEREFSVDITARNPNMIPMSGRRKR
jgi:predicted nucleotidyltransferase component of viral defense system